METFKIQHWISTIDYSAKSLAHGHILCSTLKFTSALRLSNFKGHGYCTLYLIRAYKKELLLKTCIFSNSLVELKSAQTHAAKVTRMAGQHQLRSLQLCLNEREGVLNHLRLGCFLLFVFYILCHFIYFCDELSVWQCFTCRWLYHSCFQYTN